MKNFLDLPFSFYYLNGYSGISLSAFVLISTKLFVFYFWKYFCLLYFSDFLIFKYIQLVFPQGLSTKFHLCCSNARHVCPPSPNAYATIQVYRFMYIHLPKFMLPILMLQFLGVLINKYILFIQKNHLKIYLRMLKH